MTYRNKCKTAILVFSLLAAASICAFFFLNGIFRHCLSLMIFCISVFGICGIKFANRRFGRKFEKISLLIICFVCMMTAAGMADNLINYCTQQ